MADLQGIEPLRHPPTVFNVLGFGVRWRGTDLFVPEPRVPRRQSILQVRFDLLLGSLRCFIWILFVQNIDVIQWAHARFQEVDLAEAVCFIDHAILRLDGAGILTEAWLIHHLACCWINGTPFSPVCFAATVNRFNEVAFASALRVDDKTTSVVCVGKEPFKEVGIHVIILRVGLDPRDVGQRGSLVDVCQVVHDCTFLR